MNQKVAAIIIAATPPSGCWVKALKLKRFVSLCSCSPDSQLQIKFSLFQPTECNNRLQNFYTTFNGAPNRRRRRRRVSSFVPLWFMQTQRGRRAKLNVFPLDSWTYLLILRKSIFSSPLAAPRHSALVEPTLDVRWHERTARPAFPLSPHSIHFALLMMWHFPSQHWAERLFETCWVPLNAKTHSNSPRNWDTWGTEREKPQKWKTLRQFETQLWIFAALLTIMSFEVLRGIVWMHVLAPICRRITSRLTWTLLVTGAICSAFPRRIF